MKLGSPLSATAVRVTFSDSRDDGAPEFPLILAVTYPSQEAMQGALADCHGAAPDAATAITMDSVNQPGW